MEKYIFNNVLRVKPCYNKVTRLERVFGIMKKKTNVREIAYLAMFLAILIVGGFVVYQVTALSPLPGMKYVLMGPYIACIFYLAQSKVPVKWVMLKFSLSFAMIMVFFNVFMGIAISITGIISVLVSETIGRKYKLITSSVMFATLTPIVSITLAKYMIGGVFLEVTFTWILLAGLLGCVFGLMGVFFGMKIEKYLPGN